MAKPSNINFKIDLSVNGQKQAVDLGMSLDDLGAAIAKINKASQSCHQRLGNFAMGVAGIMASINGLNDAVASLTSSYLSFDSAMKRVNTMAGLSKEGFDNIKDSVSELSQSIPLAREQLADGLYQVISNGVPKDNWIEFLNTSARSAVGGIADLGQTVTVTSTIIKNYALDWSAAQEIQDKMQLTAKNGVTSFEQLAAALPRVAGNAATLGVSIDELMAVFATLTGVSGNTAEVSTQLAAVFTSLVKPSSEAAKMAAEMGIQFNAASINAKGGFEAFLTSLQQAVKTYAESSGQLEQEIYGKLFGSAEALRALGALTGPLADKFRENIGAMADSTGTMDQAFDEMNSTAEAGMQKMKNYIASITDTAASLLSKSQPILGFVSSVALIPQGFGVLIKSFKALGGAASSMLTSAFTKLRGPLLGLAIQAQLSSGAVKGLLTALKGFGAIGLVIAAVTAVVVAFSQHAQAADKAAQSAEILRRTTEKLKESNENVADSVGRIRVELDTEAAKLRKLIDAKQDTTAAVEELNKKYGEELGCQKTAAQWLEVLTTKSQAYARAKALEAESISLAAEEYAISERKRLNQETQDKLRKEGRDKTRHVTGNLATMGSAAGANMGAGGAVVETVSKEMQAALEEAATINADAAANAEARQRVADRLAEASTDLAAGLTGTVPPGSGPDNDKGKTPAAPEGSLKALTQQIADIQARIELAVDDASRIELNRQLNKLEAEKRTIEFRYKFPDLTGDNLRAVADQIKAATPATSSLAITLPTELPKTLEQPDTLKPVAPEVIQSYGTATEGLQAMGSAMQSMAKITGEGAGAWISYAANVINAVAQALPALQTLFAANTAAAGSSTLAQNAAIGPFGWIAGIAAMASVVAALASLPTFAGGASPTAPPSACSANTPALQTTPKSSPRSPSWRASSSLAASTPKHSASSFAAAPSWPPKKRRHATSPNDKPPWHLSNATTPHF